MASAAVPHFFFFRNLTTPCCTRTLQRGFKGMINPTASKITGRERFVNPTSDHPKSMPRTETLLTFSCPPETVCHLFVNLPAMANSENPNHFGFAIHLVNNAKPSDSDAPQSGHFADKRRAGERIGA
jgi:hypothetical protein